jgi:general stress protein YciG
VKHASILQHKAVKEWLAEIGRKGGEIGGQSTSAAKTAAARKNGKLGGRPRKEDK